MPCCFHETLTNIKDAMPGPDSVFFQLARVTICDRMTAAHIRQCLHTFVREKPCLVSMIGKMRPADNMCSVDLMGTCLERFFRRRSMEYFDGNDVVAGDHVSTVRGSGWVNSTTKSEI